jgi:HD superfamily phosphohydrolase
MAGAPHPLHLVKAILDPIHGLVRMTAEEVKVIDHPLFQRLRYIKQNGLLHLVFPSATHTRFEHSVGALFVADSILQALYFNWLAAKGKQCIDAPTAGNRLVNWEDNDACIGFIYRVARLSALCHDLGHGPLSHTFETFAPTIDKLEPLLREPTFDALAPIKTVLTAHAEKHGHGHIPHEVFSCLFFAAIWREAAHAEPHIALAVACVITGVSAAHIPDDKLAGEHKRWLALMHDIVASAPADSDRMDYVERDSRSCGATYGLFDRSRVLKSFLAYEHDDGEGSVPRLGIKYSGYRAIENFVQARFELFAQIYYHKTNRALECMMRAISRRAKNVNPQLLKTDEGFDALVQQCLLLSDEAFLNALAGRSAAFPVHDSEINKIAADVISRKLWKRVFEPREAGIDDDRDMEEFLNELIRSLKEDDLVVDHVDAKATKDLATGARLLKKKADGGYEVALDRKWTDLSPLIKALGEAEKKCSRVFVQCANAERAKDLRKRAMAAASAIEPAGVKHGDRGRSQA